MKYLVIGRGFAAYGYVPALAALRREVWVPSALFNRLQPQQFHDSSDLLNVLETTTYDIEPDAIVLAIRPYELDHFVSALKDQLNPGVRLFLEKPVGVSPQASVQLLQDLSRSGVRVSVNYSFLWTSWFQSNSQLFKSAEHISCSWRFQSRFNPIKECWKSKHTEGGGALLFYAVHFFALFTHAYCIDVTHCRLLKTAWGDSGFTSQLIFSSNEGQTTQIVDLEVDCQATDELFYIRADDRDVCRLPDPFYEVDSHSTNPSASVDRRFHILQEYIQATESPEYSSIQAEIARSTQNNLAAAFEALEIRNG